MNHRGHCTFQGGVPAVVVVVDREVTQDLGEVIQAADGGDPVQPFVLHGADDAFIMDRTISAAAVRKTSTREDSVGSRVTGRG